MMENSNMHYLSGLIESHLPFKDYYDEHTMSNYEYSQLVLNDGICMNTDLNSNSEINSKVDIPFFSTLEF